VGCRPLNLLFAKDNTNVYYIEGKAKAVIDVPGFQVLDSGQYCRDDGFEKRFGYACDSQQVYCHDFFSGAPRVLRKASLNAFKRLAFGYAKDDRSVWTQGYRIEKADPGSFETISDLYSKDDRRVYYSDDPLEHASPKSFRIIAEWFTTDGRHIYFQRSRLENADLSTFSVDEDGSAIGRDSMNVYMSGAHIDGADPITFQQIGESHYYRDKQSVYYLSNKVLDVDLESFEVIGDSWGNARDKHRQYKDGQPLGS
jgi:hypothetical protein